MYQGVFTSVKLNNQHNDTFDVVSTNKDFFQNNELKQTA